MYISEQEIVKNGFINSCAQGKKIKTNYFYYFLFIEKKDRNMFVFDKILNYCNIIPTKAGKLIVLVLAKCK